MLFSSLATLLIASSALAAPVPRWKREVPQEHSHEAILRLVTASLVLDNPDNIQDSVFGLLGAKAAATGAGNIADPDCLQQATADQAFTNAKSAGDIAGMTAALQYRALERNTGSVGLASVACTSITAVNPEIAAIQQHQDPASDNAAEINKAIVLELAKQIASIGGNPLDALATGTFAPGEIGDPTAAGNTCDDADDAIGCIISLNLLVLDATDEEVNAAVDGIAAGNANENGDCPPNVTVTVGADEAKATPAASADNANANNNDASGAADAGAAAAGGNFQTFAQGLGGIQPPAITAGGKGFEVANNSDFNNLSAAIGRSCDVQHNQCANAANGGADFSVGDCDAQVAACRAAAGA